MVVLGLLILIAVSAVVVVMLLRGEDSVRIDLDALGTYRTEASVVFLVGALTLLVGVLGVTILIAGLKRGRRRRSEMRELKDRASRADVDRSHGSASSDPYDDGATPSRDDTDNHFDSTPRER